MFKLGGRGIGYSLMKWRFSKLPFTEIDIIWHLVPLPLYFVIIHHDHN